MTSRRGRLACPHPSRDPCARQTSPAPPLKFGPRCTATSRVDKRTIPLGTGPRSFKRSLGRMPSREPGFVSLSVVRETRRHEHIAPVDLRDLHRPPEFAQVTVAQLEDCESNSLEAPCIRLLAERQVRCAPCDEEVGSRLPRSTDEEGIESALGLRAERRAWHAA